MPTDIKICVIQDPVFGDVDRAFLERLGCQVVDDPEAFKLIDEETFVWACGSEQHVDKSIAGGVHPAALISGDWSKHNGIIM